MNKILFALVLAGMTALTTMAQATETYTIDDKHSTIGFGVKHMMVSTVKGAFTGFQGTVSFDPQDPEKTLMDITIQSASIDTWVKDRDVHLRGSEFLATDDYPTITFKSKIVKKMGDGYLVTGDLTIRGVTKSIDLPLTIAGPVKTPFGSDVIGLTGNVTINRQDFGVSFNKTMDQGGYMVGDIVTIEVNVEASQNKPS